VSGQLHALTTLYLGKDPLVPIRQDTGWAADPVWMVVEKINLCTHLESPDHPAHSLVTALTELPCLPSRKRRGFNLKEMYKVIEEYIFFFYF
jgi:hypothetical protein